MQEAKSSRRDLQGLLQHSRVSMGWHITPGQWWTCVSPHIIARDHFKSIVRLARSWHSDAVFGTQRGGTLAKALCVTISRRIVHQIAEVNDSSPPLRGLPSDDSTHNRRKKCHLPINSTIIHHQHQHNQITITGEIPNANQHHQHRHMAVPKIHFHQLKDQHQMRRQTVGNDLLSSVGDLSVS